MNTSQQARLLVLVFGAATALSGCSRHHGEDSSTLHPQARYRVRPAVPVVSISLEPDGTQGSDRTMPGLDSPYTFDQATSVGEAGFGRIAAVVVDSEDQMYLLDDRLSAITVFAPDGRVLQRFGRPGAVPGELAGPVSLALDGRSHLFVGSLDHSVSVFSRRRDQYQFVKKLQIGVAPQSLCVLNDRLYANAPALDDRHAIVVFDMSGRRLNAFADTYNSPNVGVNYQLRRGRIVCEQARKVVLFASVPPLAEVRAFSATGAPIWLAEISGLRTIRLVDERGGGYSLEVPKGGYHRLQSLLAVAPDTILVQYAFIEDPSRSRPPTVKYVETIVLSATTGTLLGRSRLYPSLSAVGAHVAVTAYDDPRETTPRAVVWRMERR